jgi:hypothetical protein
MNLQIEKRCITTLKNCIHEAAKEALGEKRKTKEGKQFLECSYRKRKAE